MNKIKARSAKDKIEDRACLCSEDDLRQLMDVISRRENDLGCYRSQQVVGQLRRIARLIFLLEKMRPLSPTDPEVIGYGHMIWDMIREVNRKSEEIQEYYENEPGDEKQIKLQSRRELLRISRIWLRMATIYFTSNMSVEDEDNTIVEIESERYDPRDATSDTSNKETCNG